MGVDHDAVRDGWEAVVGHGRSPEPFSPEYLLSLMTRAPRAFWRFDVDFSLDAAVRMAEFAETAGVKGTFYVMLTGSHYNALSTSGVHAIRRLQGHGHRVGLHVDERTSRTPHVAYARVARAAEAVGLGVDVHAVSFHMPSPDVIWVDMTGIESAYASRWEGRYVSDSRREWDETKTARLIENAGEGMQVCLHPEHWAL